MSSSFWGRGAVALVLTLFHVALVVALSPADTLREDYANAAQHWDSNFYNRIVQNGYTFLYPPSRGDFSLIVFFPGYPMLASFVRAITGLPPQVSVLVVAHAALWGCWMYILAFLRRWNTPAFVCVLAVSSILAYPVFFFMALGYTESLFMLSLLGFVFWSMSDAPKKWVFAVPHGIMMAATRVIGVPSLLYAPFSAVLRRFAGRDPSVRLWPAFLTAAVSSVGFLAFLAYSHMEFGFWNAFIIGQQGWGHPEPDFLRLLDWNIYRPRFGNLRPDATDEFFLRDLYSVFFPAFVIFFACTVVVDVLVRRADRRAFLDRLGWYALGLGMLFVYVSTLGWVVDGRYYSMSVPRYLITVHVLLVLALAWRWSASAMRPKAQWLLAAFVAPLCIFGLLLQLYLLRIFYTGTFIVG